MPVRPFDIYPALWKNPGSNLCPRSSEDRAPASEAGCPGSSPGGGIKQISTLSIFQRQVNTFDSQELLIQTLSLTLNLLAGTSIEGVVRSIVVLGSRITIPLDQKS